MRIYFIGAHSTGKTTLARYVSKTYDLPMINEVARAVLAENETTLEVLRTDMDRVNEYQLAVWLRQIEAEKGQNDYVSDRAFDVLAYTAEHSTGLSDLLGTDLLSNYMARVQEGRVFFLRPCRELLANDGTRETVSWESVVRIDAMIKLLLEQHCIPYLPIHTCSMQERVRTVEFVLGGTDVRTGNRGGGPTRRRQDGSNEEVVESAEFAADTGASRR